MSSFQVIVPTEPRQTNYKRIYIALEPLQKLKIATGDLIVIKHDLQQHKEKEVILRTFPRSITGTKIKMSNFISMYFV